MPVVIAFDTNLLVRALVADNGERVAVVRQLITQDTVFLSRTVLVDSNIPGADRVDGVGIEVFDHRKVLHRSTPRRAPQRREVVRG